MYRILLDIAWPNNLVQSDDIHPRPKGHAPGLVHLPLQWLQLEAFVVTGTSCNCKPFHKCCFDVATIQVLIGEQQQQLSIPCGTSITTAVTCHFREGLSSPGNSVITVITCTGACVLTSHSTEPKGSIAEHAVDESWYLDKKSSPKMHAL